MPDISPGFFYALTIHSRRVPSGHALQTYSTAITAVDTEIFCTLGDESASWFVSNGIGSRFGVFTTASLTNHDAMKALTIPASRLQMREIMRSAINLGSATVSNLRKRIDVRASLTVATAATVAFFACLGLMHVPGIVISGLSALMAVAIASLDEKGGDI